MIQTLRAALIGFGLLGAFLSPAQAQIPQPPEIAARAYLLVDVTANQVLAELDAEREKNGWGREGRSRAPEAGPDRGPVSTNRSP